MLVTNFDILKVLKFPKNHQTRFSLKSPILRSKSTLSPLGPQTGLTFKTDICAQLQISQQKEHNLDFLFLNMAEKNVGKKMWPFSPKNKRTSSVFFPSYFSCSAGSLLPGTYSRVKLISSWVCGGNIVTTPEVQLTFQRTMVNIPEIWSTY